MKGQNFFFANKSRMPAGWDARNRLSGASQRGARVTAEFEARQLLAIAIDIFGERKHLKGAAEHFRME